MTEEKKNESEGPAAKPEMNHRNENFRGAGGRGGRFNRFGGPRHQRDREDRPRPLDQVNFHVTHLTFYLCPRSLVLALVQLFGVFGHCYRIENDTQSI